MERDLLVNMIQCPDGTILESIHQHNLVEHTQEDGRSYFVDGGLAYSRRGYSDDDYEDLSCYVGDDHSIIRERFSWGSYGKYGNEPLRYTLLKDLTDKHLEALVDYTDGTTAYPRKIHNLFLAEKDFRTK